MNRQWKIGVVGCGRVGRALAIGLKNAGFPVVLLVDKNRRLLFTLQSVFRSTTVAPAIGDWPEVDILILSVHDDAISSLAGELANAGIDLKGAVVAHTSGALTSDVLAPLRETGAFLASMHPVQTFSGARRDVRNLNGIYFALEGDAEALHRLRDLVHGLHGRPFEIRKEDKVRHHLACVMASNYVIALVQVAANLLKPLGLDEEEAKQVLLPLLQASVRNARNRSLAAALTGPISRGDVNTVRRHLELMEKEHPGLLPIYAELGRITVSLAERQVDAPTKALKDISAILIRACQEWQPAGTDADPAEV